MTLLPNPRPLWSGNNLLFEGGFDSVLGLYMPELGQRLHQAADTIHRGLENIFRVGKAAQRGFGAGMAEAHRKPTNVEIGYAIEDSGYQDIVYTSCSVYRGTEALLVQDKRTRMIKTNNEHNSGGIAGGLAIGGRRSMIASQNSAGFNEGDGIVSFLGPKVNDVPVLVLMSWRRDQASEPHFEIGRITKDLARLMFNDERIAEERVFGIDDGSDFPEQFRLADELVRQQEHMAIILMPEEAFETVFEPVPHRRTEEEIAGMEEYYRAQVERERIITEQKGTFTDTNPFLTNKAFDRFEAAQMVVEYYRRKYPHVRFVVSNGFNSRTLLSIYGDDPSFLYLPGYMGGAAAVGMGLSLAREDVHFVVLDGNENRQMSAMDKHLKLNNRPNMDIVTFFDGAASSVGGAKSLDLTTDELDYSRVVQTYSSIYPRFVKEKERVQGTPQHTREFAKYLREVPPRPRQSRAQEWSSQRIADLVDRSPDI